MNSFFHAGDIGDVVYGLYVMQQLGGGELYLGPRTNLDDLQPRKGIQEDVYGNIVVFLRIQPYISRTQWVELPPFVDYDLNKFRLFWKKQLPVRSIKTTLLEMHCSAFGVNYPPTKPWLVLPKRRVSPVIIARSFRQHDDSFPWRDVVKKYQGKISFIGHTDEHEAFERDFKVTVPYHQTINFYEVGKVIAGCDLFIGNSSSPLAVADGLRKRIIQETSTETVEQAHTLSYREDHINWNNSMELPEV